MMTKTISRTMKLLSAILYTSILVLSYNIALAQSITIDCALKTANNFMYTIVGNNLKSTNITQSQPQFTSVKSVIENKDTLLFIINNKINKGFVIVAADKRAFPILGYSTDGNYDDNNQPPAFTEWIENRKDEIRYIKQNNIKPSSKVSLQWKKLNSASFISNEVEKTVPPLLQTTWSQGCYYNTLCPAGSSECGHVWTGCVATAMAQILKYWGFPTSGNGSHSYNSSYGTLSADFGSTCYQWTQMPSNVTSENNAVATLMYHCGVAVEMSYASWGSGAQDPRDELVSFFKYSPEAKLVERSNYQLADWIKLLKSQLDLKRPIYYSGGSHAFICDGYKDQDYFHFNWGWGGYADGYFYIGSLTPAGYNFNSREKAIVEIIPTDVPDSYDKIFLSENSVVLSAFGISDSITVFSGVSWSASSNQNWINLNKYSGTKGKFSLHVSANENNTGINREAIITLSSPENDDIFISIIQPPILETSPGELHNVLEGAMDTIVYLSLKGTIDARDFKTMRDSMPQLFKVDLSNTEIVAYSGTLGPRTTSAYDYPANAIPDFAFSRKGSLESITLPTTVTSIRYKAFQYCEKLSSINIPESVISIGSYCFYFCKKLTSINIPRNTTYLGKYLLYSCRGLRSVYAFPRHPVDVSSSYFIFDYIDFDNCALYVPLGSKQLYASAYAWKKFSKITEMQSDSIVLSDQLLAFGKNAETKMIKLYIDKNWVALSNQSWLTVNPSTGNGSDSIMCTVIENNSDSDRTAKVTISSSGFESKEISIIQYCSIKHFPWIEDFENDGKIPDNWNQQQIANSGINWECSTGNGGKNPTTAHSGINNVCLKDNSSSDNKTLLVTPSLDLTMIGNPQLTFWHTQQAYAYDQDKLTVFYKTSENDTLTQLATYSNNIISWKTEEIDLPNPSSDYYVAFEGNAKWGFGICLDDISITGSPIIENEISLTNKIISPTESTCFNAYNTITVAGDGTTVVLNSGSSANFIAGQSIHFLPGFHAQAGSSVDAHITTNGTFCDQLPQSIVAVNPVMEKSNPVVQEEINMDQLIEPVLKVYPNPNNGRFTVSLENFNNGAKIMIYNSMGVLIYNESPVSDQLEVDLPETKRGIYFVKAYDGVLQYNKKIIIQ